MAGKTPFYKTKTFTLTAGILIAVVCMWLAVRPLFDNEDAWNQVVNAFQQADYRSLPLIWGTLIVFYWLKAWRWRIMLAPVGNYRPVKDLLPPIMIGFSLNNVLPARIGEVARCFVFSKQQKVPFSVAVSSLVLERFFDLIAVLFYLGIGLVFIEGVDPKIQQQAWVLAGLSVIGVFTGLAYVMFTAPFVAFVEKVAHSLRIIPHGLTDKVCRLLEKGAQGMSALKSARLVFFMLGISLVKWGLNCLLIGLSLWSFGLPTNPTIAMVLTGVVAIGVALFPSPGYFGVMQLCFAAVLLLFVKGEKGEAAIFASSIYYHMTQYVPVTIVGLIYFVKSGLTLHEVEEKKEERDLVKAATPEIA
ncbi:lysylphosphatidylglycerol synthase transmembrane domain-containing protein [Thalassoglobus polymorphus]|uniref:Uncharacterized protein n=1 Tax=Thalassoglobus polymorphus TaxID=2527994 RepID=A0A517QIJ9_9PLAN|nr:lysylphosphatidylglycerol synthase transmembrane domain-containing protein [Thalassoglobus polymorphus]QDT31434.1 hypothetical protein Mal48_06670 [Thalassoglobus polymorphus]